jgi:hypothetical protein
MFTSSYVNTSASLGEREMCGTQGRRASVSTHFEFSQTCTSSVTVRVYRQPGKIDKEVHAHEYAIALRWP